MITKTTIQVLQKRRQELLSKQESLSKTRWNYEYKKRLKEVDHLINMCNDKNWLLNPSERELLIKFFKFFRDNGEANIGMTIEQFVDWFLSQYVC